MQWVRSVMDFINANEGFFLVLFTAVVAIATWKYARLTEQLVKETGFMREAETEPHLAVYLMPQERWVGLIDVVIRNFGRAPAHDITWKIQIDDDETRNRYAGLLDLALFQGLSYLPPEEQFRAFLGTGPNLLKEPPAKPVKIIAIYKTPKGEPRERSFVLDINQYRNLSANTPPEYDIAEAMKQLSKDFQRVASAYLQVLGR